MNNMSLYNKIFLIFTTVFIISVGLIGGYGMKSISDAYLSFAYELSEQNTHSLNLEIERELETVPKDIMYTSNFYALKRFLIWNTMGEELKAQKWKQIYSDALIDFLGTQKRYYKARVIDLNGDEIINVRYNKIIDKTTLVADDELQNEKNEEYFIKTLKLKKDEFYVSAMNLNKEHGKIQKPYNPVIRYATPIIDKNNEIIAVFVASLYASNVLDILEKQTKKNENNNINYLLVDVEGNYLYNKDKAKRWNKELHNGFTFNKSNFNLKKVFKDKESGSFMRKFKIYSFFKVHPLLKQQQNHWYVISSIDEDIALAKLNDFKIVFSIILAFIIFVAFFFIRTFILKITNPLVKVTHQLKALSNGEIRKEDIKYGANDEVSDIVKSTSRLINSIEGTIVQANAVANGDLSKEILLLSSNDSLGLAIRNMTSRLKEIVKLSNSLASGNYDVNILIKSNEDKLGLALLEMVKYLKTITTVAESIALGKLDVNYKVKSDDDRLGLAVLQMIKYLKTILSQADAISKEDFSNTIEVKSIEDELSKTIIKMTDILRISSKKNKNENFFSEGVGEFSDKLTGINNTKEMAEIAINTICRYIDASGGALYILDKEKQKLNLMSSFSKIFNKNIVNSFNLGEGLIGQVALEEQSLLIKNIKDEEYIVQSGTFLTKPKEVYIYPLTHDKQLFGVIEIMSFESFTNIQKDYLSKVSVVFSAALHTAIQNNQIKVLLEKSQQAFEELQVQSEELQESNVQMEEQQQQLTLQSRELQEKNNNLAKAKQEIDLRADDLEKASKYKSEFFANMSHELRTPLNSIILLSKLLTQNKDLNQKDIDKSNVINKAGNDLLLLINDILDFTKIESGNMELQYHDMFSKDIIDEVKGLFGVIAEEKNLNFAMEDSFNNSFSTDKQKLLQILKNLLSNAFKFTKDGYVSINISSNDENIIFTVKDSGIGIPKNKLNTIFDAFKQVDGSISREFGGTGLGLSISKTMVDLFKGEIKVESEFGVGTLFIVTIPLVKPLLKIDVQTINEKVINKETIPNITDDEDILFVGNELSKKNILLVDDDSRNIFALTSTLERVDAEVYNAFNGKEAIETLKSGEKIDLILMDIMMPVMDGLKAIENIKSDDNFKDIPIIAITAKTMPEDKQKCLDAGANDYLSKPLNHNALILMIKAWIK